MKLFLYLAAMLIIGLIGVVLISLIPVPEYVIMLLGFVWGNALVVFGVTQYDKI